MCFGRVGRSFGRKTLKFVNLMHHLGQSTTGPQFFFFFLSLTKLVEKLKLNYLDHLTSS